MITVLMMMLLLAPSGAAQKVEISTALTEFDKQIAEDLAQGTQFHPDYFRAYPNGCPILSENDLA